MSRLRKRKMPIGSNNLCYNNLYSLQNLLGSRTPCALPPFSQVDFGDTYFLSTHLTFYRSAEYDEEAEYGGEETGDNEAIEKVEESEAAKAQRLMVEAQKKAQNAAATESK